MKKYTIQSVLAFLLVFMSCSETKTVIEDKGSGQITGTFIVTELNETEISKEKGMSFEFSEMNKTIRGTSGCNSFFGTITKEGQSLRITNLNISERYCDEEIMKMEQDFIDALSAISSYRLKDEILTLYTDANRSAILISRLDNNQ